MAGRGYADPDKYGPAVGSPNNGASDRIGSARISLQKVFARHNRDRRTAARDHSILASASGRIEVVIKVREWPCKIALVSFV